MEFFESSDNHREVITAVNRFKSMVKNQEQYYFDSEELKDIVEYYLLRGEFEQSQDVVDYALNLHPTNSELKILKAQVLVGNLQYKESLKLIEEVELFEPYNIDLLIVKGTVLSKLKMTDKAIKCFKMSLDHAEFKDEVYYFIASEYQRNLEYDEAIKFYKNCLRENPEHESALFELNMCFECMTSFTEAIQFYNQLIDLSPYSESLWFNLAGAHCKLEEWVKAADCYDYALAINPEFSSAYFNKANALASSGDYEAAIAVYKESYEFESPSFMTYGYIGECYERLKDFDQAMSFYKKALSENEEYPEAWLGIAICLDGLGRSNEAYVSIKKALELENADPDFWYTASEIEEKLGYIEDSLNSMKSAVELDQTDISLFMDYLLLIERHLDQNVLKEAIDDGSERFSNNSILLYYKVAFLLRVGKFQMAYQTFELALTIDYKDYERVFIYYPEAKNNQNVLDLIDLYRD